MPTELIADQLVNNTVVVPNGMVINPIFDWAPILGLPVWLYITVIFVLIFLAVNIYWLLRIGRLASVKGWAESLKKMTQDDAQVWVISRVQKLTIECMTIKDNVLSCHDPMNIGMWHVNSPMGIIRVGGASAVVVSEDFDQNRDIVAEIALCHNLDMFNENLEQLKEEANEKHMLKLEAAKTDEERDKVEAERPHIMKPIENCEAYQTYGRKCITALFPGGLEIPSFSMFNPNKFRKYFPRGCSGMFFGGELIHDARKLNLRRKEKGFWEVHFFLASAFVISLIALVAAAFFPLG